MSEWDEIELNTCMCGEPMGHPQSAYDNPHVQISIAEYYLQPKATRINSMNTSLLVFLPEGSKARMLKGVYEEAPGETPGPDAKPNLKSTYSFKTYDETIHKNDLVIVPTNTRFGFTAFKIVEEDVEPDFDSSVEFKWIAGKIDLAAYNQILATEKRAIELMQQAEKHAKRKEVRKKLDEYNSEALNGALGALGHAPTVAQITTGAKS